MSISLVRAVTDMRFPEGGALPASARHLLMVLALHCNEKRGNRKCQVSVRRLADETSKDTKTVLRNIDVLIGRGLIEADRCRNVCTVYQLTDWDAESVGVAPTPTVGIVPTPTVPVAHTVATPHRPRKVWASGVKSVGMAPKSVGMAPLEQENKESEQESREGTHQHKSAASRRSLTRACSLSPDWKLSETMRQWTRREHPDWSERQIDKVADIFRDYWLGNGKPHKDWDATWRNWVRRERTISPSKHDEIMRVTAEIWKGQSDEPGERDITDEGERLE